MSIQVKIKLKLVKKSGTSGAMLHEPLHPNFKSLHIHKIEKKHSPPPPPPAEV